MVHLNASFPLFFSKYDLMPLMMQQVLVGLDTMEMINDMELFGPSEVDFGFEELDDEATLDEGEDDDGDDVDKDDNDEDDTDDEYDTVSIYEGKKYCCWILFFF